LKEGKRYDETGYLSCSVVKSLLQDRRVIERVTEKINRSTFYSATQHFTCRLVNCVNNNCRLNKKLWNLLPSALADGFINLVLNTALATFYFVSVSTRFL